jgi:hypothetical protein
MKLNLHKNIVRYTTRDLQKAAKEMKDQRNISNDDVYFSKWGDTVMNFAVTIDMLFTVDSPYLLACTSSLCGEDIRRMAKKSARYYSRKREINEQRCGG